MPGIPRKVVVKRTLGADAMRRLRHERGILERLSGVEGVPQLLPHEHDDRLVFRDDGGIALAQSIAVQPLPLERVLGVALRLCRILANVHRLGIVHKDINPSNVLLCHADQPVLIDFHIAAAFNEESAGLDDAQNMGGTLAYMPPEQTGRTGQPVDNRSDLYAVGALIHELVSGQPVFDTSDMLDLLHKQLTEAPRLLADLVPETPPLLSTIVSRLLDKQPDRRYQSADGLAHDLDRLIRALSGDGPGTFALGERDFAARLTPPSRPLGRDRELAMLEAALRDATESESGVGLFINGGAGIGKTALVNQLRPALARSRGWFVSVKFSRNRGDSASATMQVLRGLGRLLLSEPEAELATHRARLAGSPGSMATALIAQLPEFELLLGRQPPSAADPTETEKQLLLGTMAVIQSIVSPKRPLVVLLEDLQWASAASVHFVDSALAERPRLSGMLLVSTYRADEVPEAGALKRHLDLWRALDLPPSVLTLAPLQPAQVGALVGEMLRLPPVQALQLASALSERAQGNPQDTIDLINALRLDKVLTLGPGGWQWNEDSIRRFVGQNEGIDLLQRRLDELSPLCVSLLQVIDCLGGEARQALLEASIDAGLTLDPLQALAPAIEEGLLVTESAQQAITLRFRNNRVQECVHRCAGLPSRRRELQLAIARRLAGGGEQFAREAAQQYLDVLDDLHDPAERRRAALLLHGSAQAIGLSSNLASERFLHASINLLLPIETAGDAPLLLKLLTQRHLALYGLGRHDEADEVYANIESRCIDPFELAEMAGVQVHSLTNRKRWAEALTLGLTILSRLGMPKPQDLASAIGSGLVSLRDWALGSAKQADLDRPEASDPELLVLAHFIKRVLAAAFNQDKPTYTWLLLEVHGLWTRHGPSPALMSSIASLPLLLIWALKDYGATHAASRHAIDISRARKYESGMCKAYAISSLCATHWGEPVESLLTHTRIARKGLLEANDIQYATYTYSIASVACFETSPTLDSAELENDAGLGFCASTGNTSYSSPMLALKQLYRGLRGESKQPGGFGPEDFDEGEFAKAHGSVVTAMPTMEAFRALAAAIQGDSAELQRCAASAMRGVNAVLGFYVTAYTYLCHGLAQAAHARSCQGDEKTSALAELDRCRGWLHERAADAPMNYATMARLLDAERAWAVGEPWAAALAYDDAIALVDGVSRPWQRGLIHERAGRFYFSQQGERTGRPMMAEALRTYANWGAHAKAGKLVEEFPFLQGISPDAAKPAPTRARTLAPGDVVDMMGVLRASQAISSETGLTQLNERMAKLLGAMCGAESVLLAVRPRESQGWFLATSLEQGALPQSVEEAGAAGKLALSAFRYAERTREPLLLEDATRDHRFASDPALSGVAQCSMLLVPIVKQGELQAVLVMENRMRHGAFTSDRLDAVTLIAGQLAVSLDNAMLYASLERKVAERTAALETANRQLERLSVTDALTGLANRRQFNQAFEAEWRRAQECGAPLAVAMIDIDQFKQYNDHYGHQGGDACLILVAEAMKNELRGHDLIARYGGEEFAMLLRDADPQAAFAAAERVRAAVAARMEPHPKATHKIVTVSIGVASRIPGADAHATHCLAAADAALYQAKNAGRNRVEGSTPHDAGATADGAPVFVRMRQALPPRADQCLSLVSSRGGVGFVRWDPRCTELSMSSAAREILGCTDEGPLRVAAVLTAVHPADRPRVRSAWRQTVRQSEQRMEVRFSLASDPARHVRAMVAAEYSSSGRVSEVVMAIEDVSDLAETLDALSQSQARLREAQELSRITYWEWDYRTNKAKFSKGALRMLRRPDDWQPTLADIGNLAPEGQHEWISELTRGSHSQQPAAMRFEMRYPEPDGSFTHLHTVAKVEHSPDGKPRRLVATVQDVSEVKGYRSQLHSLSFFDTLTRLPNRALFVERLRETCSDASWQRQQIGLLMLDIDRFKGINDSMGHGAGDALLQQVAERLKQALRDCDMVGRLGGDEFAVMLPDVHGVDGMAAISQKVLAAFVSPFNVLGKEIYVSSSMGGALYPANAKDVDQLLQYADAAMHHAKAQGRNNFQFYSPEFTDKAAGRLALESELRRGFERGELEMYFQPKVELATGRCTGAEALMRWNHPTRGMVSPLDFIPLAEETGLIVPMGAWAIQEACRLAARWNAMSPDPLRIAVNLSARQLAAGNDLLNTVQAALQSTGCQPQWLELEITESLLLDGNESVKAALQDLADSGIKIAIDDFGTGYSALSYITRFPISVLKIDRSFVKQLPGDRGSAELVKAVVSLGISLGLELVAEGVETPEQAQHLLALGCELAQGYLYGKPVPVDVFEDGLARAY